jgi:hypothetical protein
MVVVFTRAPEGDPDPMLVLDLHDLDGAGLLHFCAGRVPFPPHQEFTYAPPPRERVQGACLVIERRFGFHTGAREKFIAAVRGERAWGHEQTVLPLFGGAAVMEGRGA